MLLGQPSPLVEQAEQDRGFQSVDSEVVLSQPGVKAMIDRRTCLLAWALTVAASCTHQTDQPKPGAVEMASATASDSKQLPSGDEAILDAAYHGGKGGARRAAKTSVVHAAKVESFDDVAALIKTLPSDDSMRHHSPPIHADEGSARIAEEQRRVQVKAWIYAYRLEADEDFHVIVGVQPGSSPMQFFTCEVSGLPPTTAPDYDELKKARRQFYEIVGRKTPNAKSYEKPTAPIPVVVEGSLFYDIDHAPGEVGPKYAKPMTAWEIHPVSTIQLQK